ncbi:MAG TPA: Hsp20/alpha crystallin family protein [Candidatus Methanomethylia archaeon]|nr:Hsp20/alpha crystallin family protein [Candidatus Methanomethylicia archaeon]
MHRDIFDEIRRIQRELDRLLSDILRTPLWAPPRRTRATLAPEYREPLVDVYETDNEVVVVAELPGVNKEDIQLSLYNRTLEIKAETRREEAERPYQLERRYTGFYTKVSLPAEVDPSKAKATFRNGVLEVKLPKLEAVRKHSIKVE